MIDSKPAGGFESQMSYISFISWSGLDIGRDRSSHVSHYEAPFAFTGKLRKVTFVLDDDQGGVVVPSFAGKTVRSAIELAEDNGIELEVVGSGVAQ